MADAWLFQDTRQKQKLGDKCPWSVGWFDPDGKKRSKKLGSKSAAEKHRQKVEGQLASGTYQSNDHKPWKAFREEYESKILPRLAAGSQASAKASLKHFEDTIKPARVDAIKTQTIDEYISKRTAQRGKLPGSTVSPATVNKDLRGLKAALRVAHDWGYLPTVPKFRMVREPEKLPRFITPEHFAAIYSACDDAAAPDWWRALLVFGYMTGWRISEILALRRDDADLDAATAKTRAESNKGKRDAIVPLAPIVVEHLRKIPGFSPLMFPWPENYYTLWVAFHAIQDDARIDGKPLGVPHYGFHDLRRSFATMNADRLTADALQSLMRHKSYLTTKRYISVAKQLAPAVANLYTPTLPKPKLAE